MYMYSFLSFLLFSSLLLFSFFSFLFFPFFVEFRQFIKAKIIFRLNLEDRGFHIMSGVMPDLKLRVFDPSRLR